MELWVGIPPFYSLSSTRQLQFFAISFFLSSFFQKKSPWLRFHVWLVYFDEKTRSSMQNLEKWSSVINTRRWCRGWGRRNYLGLVVGDSRISWKIAENSSIHMMITIIVMGFLLMTHDTAQVLNLAIYHNLFIFYVILVGFLDDESWFY